ncbi:MAG: hypothetical protein AAGF44_05415 [Pseudomonadota bacterium]
MDLSFTAERALETLFDPTQPFIYIFLVPGLILIALGRVKLAVLWIVLAGLYTFFGGKI